MAYKAPAGRKAGDPNLIDDLTAAYTELERVGSALETVAGGVADFRTIASFRNNADASKRTDTQMVQAAVDYAVANNVPLYQQAPLTVWLTESIWVSNWVDWNAPGLMLRGDNMNTKRVDANSPTNTTLPNVTTRTAGNAAGSAFIFIGSYRNLRVRMAGAYNFRFVFYTTDALNAPTWDGGDYSYNNCVAYAMQGCQGYKFLGITAVAFGVLLIGGATCFPAGEPWTAGSADNVYCDNPTVDNSGAIYGTISPRINADFDKWFINSFQRPGLKTYGDPNRGRYFTAPNTDDTSLASELPRDHWARQCTGMMIYCPQIHRRRTNSATVKNLDIRGGCERGIGFFGFEISELNVEGIHWERQGEPGYANVPAFRVGSLMPGQGGYINPVTISEDTTATTSAGKHPLISDWNNNDLSESPDLTRPVSGKVLSDFKAQLALMAAAITALQAGGAKPWAGKKIGFAGDSETYRGLYIAATLAALGATVFVQKGFPGAGFDGIGQGIRNDTSNPFAGCDLVYIFAGTNEYGTQNKYLGSLSDRAGSFTIYGEIWNPYNAIRAQAPDCTICYVTPNDRGAFTDQPVSPAANSKGVTLRLIAQAMKEVAALQTKSYCFDLLAVSPITPANAGTTTEDQLHMLQATGTTVGGQIGGFTNTSVPYVASSGTAATGGGTTTTPAVPAETVYNAVQPGLVDRTIATNYQGVYSDVPGYTAGTNMNPVVAGQHVICRGTGDNPAAIFFFASENPDSWIAGSGFNVYNNYAAIAPAGATRYRYSCRSEYFAALQMVNY